MIVDLQPRLPEVGKIKIGGKGEEKTSRAGNAYRQPVKLDHFIVTGLERDATDNFKVDGELMKSLLARFPSPDGQLRSLPIALLDDDIENVFPTQYVAYIDRKRIATSDGATITWYCDPTPGKNYAPLKTPIEKPNANRFVQTATLDYKGTAVRMFKAHGTLHAQIADEKAKWGGVYKFRTTSIIGINQIVGGLRHIQLQMGGFLRNVPLRMVVRSMEVSPDGKATTVHVVHVEFDGKDLAASRDRVAALAEAEAKQFKRLTTAHALYLNAVNAPGDEDESEEEQADVSEEFHHETVTVAAKTAPAVVEKAAPAVEKPASVTPAPAPAQPAAEATADAPAESHEDQLRRCIAEAKTPEHIELAGKNLVAMKGRLEAAAEEHITGEYYAKRQEITGKEIPSTHAAGKPKTDKKPRTPPPPPARTAAAEPTSAPAPAAPGKVDPKDIPF